MNLDAGESTGVDIDLSLAGVEAISLSGGGGNDHLSAAGSPETGAPYPTGVSLDGGSGADVVVGGPGGDTIGGGTGFDTVDYSSATGPLAVSIGNALSDDGITGEGDDVLGTIEVVLGGSGDDLIQGDASAELLQGGGGTDTLNGNDGDDELRGQGGDDHLAGGAGDDLLIGGPGNDGESGGESNDNFIQSDQKLFWADGPGAIADTGVTSLSLTVAGISPIIYDVNARIDLEHPFPQDLQITLISPAGTRNRLTENVGNGTPFCGTVFDSEERTNISSAGAAPLEGRYHPDGSMEIFDGENPNGVWTLEIRDDVAGAWA